MAKISFEVEINNKKINLYMELTGQDLYYFEEREEKGRAAWIKDHLGGIMKISNIEIGK